MKTDAQGWTADLLVADHQNKTDVAASIARQWFDSGVDVVADVTNSAVALAVAQIAREKNKVMLASGPATSATPYRCCHGSTTSRSPTVRPSPPGTSREKRASTSPWP